MTSDHVPNFGGPDRVARIAGLPGSHREGRCRTVNDSASLRPRQGEDTIKDSYLSVALALARAGSAVADNLLSIDGVLTSSDSIAIGYNGPDAPNQNTFYYDAFTFTINMDGVYTISMEALDTTFAPWIGVYANDYNPLDYFAPAPFALWGSELCGDTIGGATPLSFSQGTYQVVAASYFWIEEPLALEEGAYRITITGQDGADINLVPAPGAAVLAMAGGLVAMKRKR